MSSVNTIDTTNVSNLRSVQENIFGWFSLVSAIALTIGVIVVTFVLGSAAFSQTIGIVIIVFIWATVPKRLLPYQVRVILQLLLITVLVSFGLFRTGGAGAAVIGLFTLAILTATFLNQRYAIALLVIESVLLLVVGWQASTGNLELSSEQLNLLATGGSWINISFGNSLQILIIVTIVVAVVRSTRNLLEQQRILTQTITDNRNSLENQVLENTKALETTVNLSRRLSNLLDRQQLVTEVVEQIQQAFNYYHVHIYLLDDFQEYLIMVGGTGEAGSALVIGKHKIAMGEGIVGLTAKTRETILVQDVYQNDDWLPNTLLPETKSEVAVPIMLEDELLGVLDVQDDKIGRFAQSDVDLLLTIATQFAIASRTAAIYEQIQARLKHQTHINQVGQKIELSPNVTFTLHTAARELYQSLNANRVGVTLFPKALRPGTKAPKQDTRL